MPRRQAPVLRNLDDPLKILNLLTLRSCALVLVCYAALTGVDAVFGLGPLLFGRWAFFFELACAGLVALGLALAERADDEHLVPSAIRYVLSRPHSFFYSGGAPPSRLEDPE